MNKIEATNVGQALDGLALALAGHGHVWTDQLRTSFELAIETVSRYGGCKETDSSVSAKQPRPTLSIVWPPRSGQA